MRQQVVCVGIVDSEPPFRAGVRAELERAGYRVVDGVSVESLIAGARLDLLLVEERLLVDSAGVPPFALIARRPTIEGLARAFADGAIGYIDRGVSGERLRVLVEDALAGIPVVPPTLATLLLDQWRPRPSHGNGEQPTRRQRQVQLLAEQGLSTSEIAAALGLSPITVRRHRGDLAKAERAA